MEVERMFKRSISFFSRHVLFSLLCSLVLLLLATPVAALADTGTEIPSFVGSKITYQINYSFQTPKGTCSQDVLTLNSEVVGQTGEILTVATDSTFTSGKAQTQAVYKIPLEAAWRPFKEKHFSRQLVTEHPLLGSIKYSEMAEFSQSIVKNLTVNVTGQQIGRIRLEVIAITNSPVPQTKAGGLWLIPELMPPSAGVVRVDAPDSDFSSSIINEVSPFATYSIWCGTQFNLLDNSIVKARVYYTYLLTSGSWDTSLGRFVSGGVGWVAQATSPLGNWSKTGEGYSVNNYGSYIDAQGWANFLGIFPLGQYTMWLGLPSHRTKMYYGNSFGIIRNVIYAYNSTTRTWVLWKDKTYLNGYIPNGTVTTKQDYIVP
jgi:hypothetical protein